MKKRNIGICIITTTLLMGGHAKATELILAKDHTNVVNQAAEIAAYKSNRPPVNKRLFTSKAVEAEIIRVKKLLTNQKLAWMFENCFPNTLETTVHYRTTNGKPDTFVIQVIFMPCGYVTPEHRFGLIYNWPVKIRN